MSVNKNLKRNKYMPEIINNFLIFTGRFATWFIDNWLTIFSIVLSGLVSLLISAVYFNKGNRNSLQMTMLFPITILLKECYSTKNYKALCDLSNNYCVRFMKKSEKRLLSKLVSSYKEVSNYSMVDMNADILFSYFEYVLRKNHIEVKPVPIEHEGEVVYYDYPPDLHYLNYDLEKVLKKYDPDFQPEECKEAIVSLFLHYGSKCYSETHLQFFNDYSLDEVFRQSKIKKNWDCKFDEIEKIKCELFDLKIVKELIGKQRNG